MTIPRVPELALFRQPLDTAGEFILEQRVGYFHLWRFETAAGALALDGEVQVSFGTGAGDDLIPFTYNGRMQFTVPCDRLRVRWAAQADHTAVFLPGADANALEAFNAPARQVVVFGGVTSLSQGNVAVNATGAAIRPPNTLRSRTILWAMDTNTQPVYIGGTGVASTNAIPLFPGQSMVINGGAEIRGIAFSGSQNIRYMEELS